jgi:hypothetical protein
MPAKQALLIAVVLIIMVANGFAQNRSSSPDMAAIVPATGIAPRLLVDCPTAATLPRASFDVHVRDFAGGGLLASINVGLHRRFMLGVSYGGTAVLGEHKPTWQDHPEFEVKYQIVPETYAIPAVAVGFASQGYGPFIDSLDRFTYKSRGFYAVVSKAYQTYEWSSGFHGGINYSLEHTKDHDDSPNIFFGFDMNVNRDVAVVAEYDLALNDNRGDLHGHGGRGRGYFNMGLRWIFMERLELGIDFKNLFNNRKDSNQMSRELRINYYEFF